ncbi:uncharacterized protein LOC131434088 [Malaya genurostris]|uniref:uncharacterized protein LOC131434088 n=1 Tax=Malaya genurostris TaxID=325434 RepID=UPI0026F3FD77|nr:uncharacterized protein LOC131434088 [Malaya genurostris]
MRVLQRFTLKWVDSSSLGCFEAYRNDPYYAFCKICLVKICVARGGKSNLSSHLVTQRHCDANDQFYTAIEVECADHATLHAAIVAQFNRDNIDYKNNLRGFASDGASVMMGRSNSVMRLFKKECPGMISIKCTCHSLALCASYACEKVPVYLEQLMRDIYNYLSSSPKRAKEFQRIQHIVDVKPLKILQPSATRWLSLEAVIKRNLERFDELNMFFSFQVKYDQNSTAIRILNHLNDPTTKPLLLFLNYVLSLINNVNRIFQSVDSKFFEIYNETKTLLAVVLGNLCREDYVMRFYKENVDAADFENFIKSPEEIYVGVEANQVEKSIEQYKKLIFKSICRDFYIELVKQILKRFDFTNPIIKTAASLNPQTFMELPNLNESMIQFPRFLEGIDKQELDNEFRRLKISVTKLNILETNMTWPQLLDVKTHYLQNSTIDI